MFMNQVFLKTLSFNHHDPISEWISNIPPFITYPGSMDCLRNLSELSCSSNLSLENFHQLSQLCHHIRSLNITFKGMILNGLLDLISVQPLLTCLSIL